MSLMTFIMTPVLLSLLFISVTCVHLRLLSKTADKTDDFTDVFEGFPRPKTSKEIPVQPDDIAVPNTWSRNADPCIVRGCKWPKSGPYVNVPFYISSNYTPEEQSIIVRGLESFHKSTCIRFVPWTLLDSDYLHFFSEPESGCWSYLGRQRGGQYISLEKSKCLQNSKVQHEVLHALGFNHEQVRTDRDKYVQILFKNIKPERQYNFRKVETNNLGTPYDFNSVMHYGMPFPKMGGQPSLPSPALSAALETEIE
ncbi:high choriolytic enzyme 2-like isoform X2 [Fundulus heteroclitus]|uniref:high choriolytic enzyme 2-like isoform X2 n=1 Tax=Fundulus heteroclitus TaxID=8078 RepID=UPI00165A789A|nr:high choriolytic enzyme 2-like isoform X2 [Fundulus heteroclitus]